MAPMEIVTCPSTDDFMAFNGGMIAVRAAAYVASARAGLSVVTSSDAVSGSYVQDEQEATNFAGAADTLVIDPGDLPLETGFHYDVFFTARYVGTADLAGREGESFWRYDDIVIRTYASDDDFVAKAMRLLRVPRAQTQFSLVQMNPSVGAATFVDPGNPWRFRLFRRASGGDVASQIEQVILVPTLFGAGPVGPYTSADFQYSSVFGNKPAEATVEASLESGIYTLDASQPVGDDFRDVSDVQDSDGSDPEASVLDVEPGITDKSVYHIGGGIVFAEDQEVEDDQFSRTHTGDTVGSGGNVDWGDSPYGYHWNFWNRATLFYSEGTPSVDGSVAYLGPAYTPGYYAPLLLNGAGQRSHGQRIGGFRLPSFDGPILEDGRDWRVRTKVSIDDLPTDVVEGSEGPGYPAPSEDGLVNIDVGQFSADSNDLRASIAARIIILADGSASMVMAQYHLKNTAPTFGGTVEYGTPVDLGTYTPGDWLWVEYARQGYNVYAKVWYDGDTEPADYQFVERIRVPYDSSSWDTYTYDNETREDRSWGNHNSTQGTPGVALYAQTHYDTRVTLACDEFHVHFHADWLDETFDPTDVFLRVDEQGGGTVGDELNMGSKSQNWVVVGDREWPAPLDIYQWNDVDSQPLQWMTTGLTFSRLYYRSMPQIYRRVFG